MFSNGFIAIYLTTEYLFSGLSASTSRPYRTTGNSKAQAYKNPRRGYGAGKASAGEAKVI